MRCRLVQMPRYDVCESTDNTGGAIQRLAVMQPRTPFRALLVQLPHQYPLMNEREKEIVAHRGTFFPHSSVQSLYVTALES